MQLSSVVLPAPLGPMIPRMSPGSTRKLTFVSAATPPKRLLTPSSSSSAIALDRRLAQGSPQVGEGKAALPAEEVDHAARDEDDGHGEQDAKAYLREDGHLAAASQRLDQPLEHDRPRHRAEERP